MLDKALIEMTFAGQKTEKIPLCPDLSWWYEEYLEKGTMPSEYKTKSLYEIGREIGVITWKWLKPVVTHYGKSSYAKEWVGDKLIHTAKTPIGILESVRNKASMVTRLIKSPDDFRILKEFLTSINVSIDYAMVDKEISQAPKDQLLWVKAPSNPISQIFHRWHDPVNAIFYMLDNPSGFDKIVKSFDNLLIPILEALKEIDLKGNCFMFPDCIDGTFMTPPIFEKYIAPYYSRACSILKSVYPKNRCVAHFDGMVKPLLPLLKHAGLDGVEAITTWPQNELEFEEARSLIPPEIVMWGGIPSTALSKVGLPNDDDFERLARRTVASARKYNRIILGVADQVPPEACAINRLKTISKMLNSY